MEEHTQNSPETPPLHGPPDLDNPLSFLEDYDHAIPLKPLRTSFNLPAYHRQILTPSEQLHLQSALGDLKNLLLRRVAFSGEVIPEKLAPTDSAERFSSPRPVCARDFRSDLDILVAAQNSSSRTKGARTEIELMDRDPICGNEAAGDAGPSATASGMRAGPNHLKRRAEAVEENHFTAGIPSSPDAMRNKVRIVTGPDGTVRCPFIADAGAKEQQTSKDEARASTLPRQPDRSNNMPDIIASSYKPSQQRLENLPNDARALRRDPIEALQQMAIPSRLGLNATREDILEECKAMMKAAAAAAAARSQKNAPKHHSTPIDKNNVQGPTRTPLVPRVAGPLLNDATLTNNKRPPGRTAAQKSGASNASRPRNDRSRQYRESGCVTDEDPEFSWPLNPDRRPKKHAPRKGNKVDDPAYRYTKPDTTQEAADDAIRPDFDDINPSKPPRDVDFAFKPGCEDEEIEEEPATSTMKKPTRTRKGKRKPKIVTLAEGQSGMGTPVYTPVSNSPESRSSGKKVPKKINASKKPVEAVSADVSAKKTSQKKLPAKTMSAPKRTTPQKLSAEETPSRARRSSPRLARK